MIFKVFHFTLYTTQGKFERDNDFDSSGILRSKRLSIQEKKVLYVHFVHKLLIVYNLFFIPLLPSQQAVFPLSLSGSRPYLCTMFSSTVSTYWIGSQFVVLWLAMCLFQCLLPVCCNVRMLPVRCDENSVTCAFYSLRSRSLSCRNPPGKNQINTNGQ